eukprot:2535504-Heterocapsa_arctica.AAC.1
MPLKQPPAREQNQRPRGNRRGARDGGTRRATIRRRVTTPARFADGKGGTSLGEIRSILEQGTFLILLL